VITLKRHPVFAVVIAASLIAGLGSCSSLHNQRAPESRDRSESPVPSSTPSSAAEDSGLAVGPGDELFTFSAKAETEYGAKLAITMVLHLPVEWDTAAGTRMIEYLDSHGVTTSMTDTTWDKQNNVSLGVVDIQVVPSGEPWLENSEVHLALGPGLTMDVVLGLSGRDINGKFTVTFEGSGHAIVAFPAFDGRPDSGAWAESTQLWGLVSPEGDTTDNDLVPRFSDCSVVLTNRASLSSWVSTWPQPSGEHCYTGIV
jgi:hypothetical protein